MSRRDQIRMTDEEVDAFLAGRHTMNLASISPDGSIHLVAMWYGFLDGAPAVWTYGKSQKVLNLRRDPRITGLVETGETYEKLKGVELVGTARIVEDRDTVMAVGRNVSGRYTGPVPDEALEQIGAKRVAILIDVAKTVSWDHGKLGGAY
ncbi:MAG TPA: pyridoxamine 5'-phosphate oxidase family protein [Acidimicrobiales bacterium]|jgi:PPOX class probable F420-dependent enzyme|nr:pyridoxamine 5'-phosphate oxidase family protein [Acidimicrobiales bacterium]